MTSAFPPLPLGIDPLVDEARGRARRRRLRTATALMLAAATAVFGTLVATHWPRSTGADGARAALRMFAGTWGGHGKGLVITPSGRGTESVAVPAPGYKARFFRVQFRITRIWGPTRYPLASAVVTKVHLPFPGSSTKSDPQVGETGTLRIVHGVLHTPWFGDLFCNGDTPAPLACGA